MNQEQANAMAALLGGVIGSLVAVCKFLVDQDAITQDQLVLHLQRTLSTLEPEVTDPRSLIPLRNLIAGIQMERPNVTLQ
jgi:hypothetical protein